MVGTKLKSMFLFLSGEASEILTENILKIIENIRPLFRSVAIDYVTLSKLLFNDFCTYSFNIFFVLYVKPFSKSWLQRSVSHFLSSSTPGCRS